MKSEYYTVSSKEGLSHVGALQTKQGSLPLPCVAPVIKPTIFDRYWVSLLREHPPHAIMINASILSNWPMIHKMIAQGIHHFLNYNGIIFSDGGGFSKESGNVHQRMLLTLQLQLGVDVITTLDYPVRLSRTWVRRERIRHSVDNALIAGGSMVKQDDILLFASVHGPSSREITSTIAFLERHSSFDGYALGSLLSIKSNYKTVVDLVIAARRAIPEKPLHVYGIVGAATYLLMFYLGVDSVDSQGALLSGGTRQYYVPGKTDIHFRKLEGMSSLPCSCEACKNMAGQDLSLREKIALHNFFTVQREISLIRQLIKEGSYEKYLKTRFDQKPVLKRVFQYATRKIKRIL